MTFVDAVLVIWRRWYVFVLVLAVAVTGFVVLDARRGLYASKPVIQFMRPGAQAIQIYNGLDDTDIIGFAQTVAEAVNDGHPVQRYAFDDAPLYGAGLRQEIQVGVPSTGGQWGASFDRAEITISIVGSDREWVAQTQRSLIERVLESAKQNQDMLKAPLADRVSYTILPASRTIEHIASPPLSRAGALAALLTAGMLVGGWGALTLDRRLQPERRRLSRPRARAGAPIVVGEGLTR